MEQLKNNRLMINTAVSNLELQYAREPEQLKEHIQRDMLVKLGLALKPKVEITEQMIQNEFRDETIYTGSVYVLSPDEFRAMFMNYMQMKQLIGYMAEGYFDLSFDAQETLLQVLERERQIENQNKARS